MILNNYIKRGDNMKIALDFGHGGKDPGAVDEKGDDTIYPDKFYTEESKLVRHIGLKLSAKLDENHEIYLVRPNEDYVNLEDRTELANADEVDIFISLHANASANRKANGIETLHYPGSEEGIRLASKVQRRVIERSKATNRGIKPREDLFVLKGTNMPSILFEIGFITNNQEEQKLHNKAYQKQIIEGIYEGVQKYGR